MQNMRVWALVVVCLIVGQAGGSVLRFDSPQRKRATGSLLSALRRTAGEVLVEDPVPCFSLRENRDQQQLLCNDRRSKFNVNPFGLRFGKRHQGYISRRAVRKARTAHFSPLSLSSIELEVPT